jgi:hypothetical protein
VPASHFATPGADDALLLAACAGNVPTRHRASDRPGGYAAHATGQ